MKNAKLTIEQFVTDFGKDTCVDIWNSAIRMGFKRNEETLQNLLLLRRAAAAKYADEYGWEVAFDQHEEAESIAVSYGRGFFELAICFMFVDAGMAAISKDARTAMDLFTMAHRINGYAMAHDEKSIHELIKWSVRPKRQKARAARTAHDDVVKHGAKQYWLDNIDRTLANDVAAAELHDKFSGDLKESTYSRLVSSWKKELLHS